MANLDKLHKEYNKMTTRRAELQAQLARTKTEAEQARAAMAEGILGGGDPDKLADQARRLELRAEGLSGALALLDGQIKAQAETIAAEQKAQAEARLAAIDAQARESFDLVLDSFYQAAGDLEAFGALLGDGFRLASQYNLTPGAGLRLQALTDSLADFIADGVKIIKQTRPDLIAGRPEVKRRPGSAVLPEYKPEPVLTAPMGWLEAPKPGQLR